MGSSSGLIIAFVVAVWAAYFVPLVLRRYDEASRNASLDASGPLSRLISQPKSSQIVDDVAVDEPVAPVEVRPVASPAARLAAQRRRRTLITLLAVTAAVGAAAGLKVIPVWSVAVPVALVVLWLAVCRTQVRSERGLVSAPSAAPSSAHDVEDTITVSGHFVDLDPHRKHTMEDVALEADALDDQLVIAVPAMSTTGQALWDPLPVTVPTYVTKPRAGRTVRTIDFTQAGTWTSGHVEGEDVDMPQRDDDAGEHRRAVGH